VKVFENECDIGLLERKFTFNSVGLVLSIFQDEKVTGHRIYL
jgi:hypothetical protein